MEGKDKRRESWKEKKQYFAPSFTSHCGEEGRWGEKGSERKKKQERKEKQPIACLFLSHRGGENEGRGREDGRKEGKRERKERERWREEKREEQIMESGERQ